MSRFENLVRLFSLIIIVFCISCKHDDKTIIIKGDIKGLKTNLVYLYKVYPVGSPPIDSARVVKDQFEFKIHTDTTFQPELGYIEFTDFKHQKNTIGVINPYSPNKNKPDLYVDFYIEPGTTTLLGNISKNKHAGAIINAGEQNDFYFKYVNMPFIRIKKDSIKRTAQINYYKDFIHNNSHAFWAMFALNNWRFDLTNAELKSMYLEFDKDLRQAYLGRSVNEFLKARPNDYDLKPNLLLTSTDEKQMELIDTTKKLNMIIFWASWCGPCKEEIPVLKKINAAFKNNAFRMVSVSLDKDKKQWKQMLNIQKMPWQQLDIEAKDLNNVSSKYNLGSIPQVYFINSKRKLIGKIDGFDPANEEVFKKIITKGLN